MAKEKIFVRGDNIDAQMTSINRALVRLSRRNFAATTVVMPKIPLTGLVQTVGEDGIIGRFLIPLDGFIRKAYMYVDWIAEKVKPRLSMTLQYEGGSRTEELVYRTGANTMARDVPVPAGARIVLSTSNPESVKGISIGLVFEVTVASTVKEKLALDTVLSVVEEQDVKETTED